MHYITDRLNPEPFESSIRARESLAAIERSLQQFVHALRIRLPLRGLHHLAHEESKSRRFPGSVLSNGGGVLRQHLADEPRDLGLVVDLRQSFGLNDRIGALP